MDELHRFIETAKIARTVFTSSGIIPKNTPERLRLVQVMQELGAEIRIRKPITEVRKLLEDENPDVRGWAAPQFLEMDPEWAGASLLGLISKITTAETLALTRRARQAPPARPTIEDMSDNALVERFEDAATREYATRFLDCVGEPGDMELRNSIVIEVTDVMRGLKSRKKLALLVPLLESPIITIRRRAAIACLAVFPDRASAVLDAVVATGNQDDSLAAKRALDRWRRGECVVYGVV
jgi:HEAT repeat protein